MGQPAKPIELAPAQPAVGGAVADVIVLDERRRRSEPARVYLRRRVALGLAMILLVAVAIVGVGRIAATAGPEDLVSGHAVVEPGETLWDVAYEHAPAGTDPRAYLDEIVELNGFDASGVPAWTVVLLPAH